MARSGFLLIETRQGWRLAALNAKGTSWCQFDAERDLPIADVVERTAAVVAEHDNRATLIVAPGSDSTLVTNIEPPAEGRSRTAMAYLMESQLPLAAEQMTMDFVAQDGQFMGVALETAVWSPLIEYLEFQGLRVHSIIPAALLAFDELRRCRSLDEFDALVWQDGEDADVFILRDGKLSDWAYVRDARQNLMLLFAPRLISGDKLRVGLCGVGEIATESDSPLPFALQAFDADSTPTAAAKMAAALLTNSSPPLVELRRDGLTWGDPLRAIRSHMWWCLASALLLLLCLTVAFWHRGQKLRQQAAEMRVLQQDSFRRVFAKGRVPLAVVSRLRSEKSKISGARGVEGKLDLPVPALTVLHRMLSSLPPTMRYRLREIRIENGGLDVEVELRTFANADTVASSLREEGFEVEPPSSVQQSNRAVSARLFGRLSDARKERRP